MTNNTFSKIKKDFVVYNKKRRIVIQQSNEALNLSKRAIFAFHRDNFKEADESLGRAEKIFADLDKLAKDAPKLRHEGAWRAALEENIEARLFGSYLKNKRIDVLMDKNMDNDIYLGGLCDFTGELFRRAIKEATAKNTAEVKKIKAAMEQVVHNLIQLDLTGYLRTKYDQAKNNLRKIEEVMYELSIRS
ncbi:hypothetical protein KJ969_02735 [Patescibacteria group bacterium]|nr:hypothetical protein [Patescibacteria group bacterium]MBU1922225.1 hypothetical protein [Patescibacteria group bacterium]